MSLQEKTDRLLALLRSYGSCAVAFSGGVDSAVVAKAAQSALGDAAVAVTGVSASLADGELEAAQADCRADRHSSRNPFDRGIQRSELHRESSQPLLLLQNRTLRSNRTAGEAIAASRDRQWRQCRRCRRLAARHAGGWRTSGL